MLFKKEQITALRIENELVCPKCLSKVEWDELEQDEVLTNSPWENDEIWFCDRCGSRINA